MGFMSDIINPPRESWRDDAQALAQRLGVAIPGHIDARAWALPIIEALLKRIEELEKK